MPVKYHDIKCSSKALKEHYICSQTAGAYKYFVLFFLFLSETTTFEPLLGKKYFVPLKVENTSGDNV